MYEKMTRMTDLNFSKVWRISTHVTSYQWKFDLKFWRTLFNIIYNTWNNLAIPFVLNFTNEKYFQNRLVQPVVVQVISHVSKCQIFEKLQSVN